MEFAIKRARWTHVPLFVPKLVRYVSFMSIQKFDDFRTKVSHFAEEQEEQPQILFAPSSNIPPTNHHRVFISRQPSRKQATRIRPSRSASAWHNRTSRYHSNTPPPVTPLRRSSDCHSGVTRIRWPWFDMQVCGGIAVWRGPCGIVEGQAAIDTDFRGYVVFIGFARCRYTSCLFEDMSGVNDVVNDVLLGWKRKPQSGNR